MVQPSEVLVVSVPVVEKQRMGRHPPELQPLIGLCSWAETLSESDVHAGCAPVPTCVPTSVPTSHVAT